MDLNSLENGGFRSRFGPQSSRANRLIRATEANGPSSFARWARGEDDQGRGNSRTGRRNGPFWAKLGDALGYKKIGLGHTRTRTGSRWACIVQAQTHTVLRAMACGPNSSGPAHGSPTQPQTTACQPNQAL